jgi:hypothetical protein
LLLLVLLGWGGMLAGLAWSQEGSPARLDNPTPTPPSVPKGEAPAAIPPAGQPGPAWPPYQPGLLLESDCFADAEVALVFPRLHSLLTSPVAFTGGVPANLVSLRNARLDPTVSPLFQVGAFRFGPGYGELALTYRLLAAEGTDDCTGHVHSRLNLQTVSLDYLRKDCRLRDDLLLSWDVGARLQVVFFDTQAQAADTFQQARNYFFGAGPHAGVGLTQRLSHGFGLYGCADAALIVGYNTAQNFVLTTSDGDFGTRSGSASQQTQPSPSFAVQTGLAWTPPWLPAARLRTGYRFEQWYELGHVARSRGDLSTHELFLSVELGY